MPNLPPSLPESGPKSAPPSKPPRDSDESTKRWLAVLIAFVTLLVALTSFLQADAAGRNARLNRLVQESALDSTTVRARGQQETAFAYYVAARYYDEIRAEANRYTLDLRPDMAGAYITASQQLTQLSPLLAPPYSMVLPDRTGWSGRYRLEAETWVVTSTLLSQRREALSLESDIWDGKGNNYVAAIAVFAVSLFLFGLAATLGGCVRWMFVGLGAALTAVTMLWVVYTAFIAVHHTPDAALTRFAQGMGMYWQGQYPGAIAAFDEATKLDPDYANPYSQRGFAYLRQRPPKLDSAVKEFELAVKKGNDKYEVYWDLGWAYYLAGDYPRSMAASQKALDINEKVCGPYFNIAVAQLASGDTVQAEKEYNAAISRCERVLKDSLDAGLGAPSSLWLDMQGAVNDIENLFCQVHQLYCFDGRDQPTTRNVKNPDAIKQLGERMRKRLKEALTAMETQHTSAVKPGGATMTLLRFGNRVDDERGVFQSYAERTVFPNDGRNIFALWNYTGMTSTVKTTFKVFRDGFEEVGLRYVYDWGLKDQGTAEKQISGRLVLQPGDYTVEIYANGELLTQGSFTIIPDALLPAAILSTVNPQARVTVGSVLFGDDFNDNTHGWWTGNIERSRVGTPANGEYKLQVTRAGDYWRTTCLDCGIFTDFYYEIDATYVDGPQDWGYGLVARARTSMSGFYYFFVSGDGSYTIGKIVDDKLTAIQSWTKNSLVKPAGTNRIGIMARGSTLEFFVNGQSIRRVTDTALANGYIGTSVEHENLNVTFSKARVWQLR